MSTIHRRGVLLDGIGSEFVRSANGGPRKTLSEWIGSLQDSVELEDLAETFTSGDATPDVSGSAKWITAGSTSITNFDGGTEGQVIHIYRGDSDIVITDNGNIDPIIAGNLTLSATKPSAAFRLASGVWKQISEAGAQSAAMTPVVQASTVAAGAALLLANGAAFSDSVSFTLGTSGAPNVTSPTAGDALNNFIAYFDTGSASADALCYAVGGIARLKAGSRQIGVGGYFASINEGTWSPGASSEAGGVAVFTSALTDVAGAVFGGGFHAEARTTAGAQVCGSEFDTIVSAASATAKMGVLVVSPNGDTGTISTSFTISGTANTALKSAGFYVAAIGAGTGYEHGVLTIKSSGGTQPITTTGKLWRAGGFTCAYGLDWRDMVFSSGAALFPNNSVIAARNAADSADVPIAKVNASNNVDLANGALILTPGTSVLATDAETRAQSSTTKALTPANLAARASFSANKAGSAQASIATATPTKVTFDTEDWDTGSLFDTTNSRWTPPAGKVRLSASVFVSTITNNSEHAIAIYKNGSLLRQFDTSNGTTSYMGLNISILDNANGTDYYEVYVTLTTGSTATVNGGTSFSYFQGEQV